MHAAVTSAASASPSACALVAAAGSSVAAPLVAATASAPAADEQQPLPQIDALTLESSLQQMQLADTNSCHLPDGSDGSDGSSVAVDANARVGSSPAAGASLLSVPASVLVHLCQEWLDDCCAARVARTSAALLQALRGYRLLATCLVHHAARRLAPAQVAAISAARAARATQPGSVPRAFWALGSVERVHYTRAYSLAGAHGDSIASPALALPASVRRVSFGAQQFDAAVLASLPGGVRAITCKAGSSWLVRDFGVGLRFPAALTELHLAAIKWDSRKDSAHQAVDALRRMELPPGVTALTLHRQPEPIFEALHELRWPRALNTLTIVQARPFTTMPLPSVESCPDLTALHLGGRFEGELEALPGALQTLVFEQLDDVDGCFASPSSLPTLPPTLTTLHLLNGFKQKLAAEMLPPSLTELHLSRGACYPHPLPALPPALRSLELCSTHVAPLPPLPPTVTHLFLRQELKIHARPQASLPHLPSSLTSLHFEAEAAIPQHLDHLAALKSFTFPQHAQACCELVRVRLPSSLRALASSLLARVNFDLPAGLEKLHLGTRWMAVDLGLLRHVRRWPEGLRVFSAHASNDSASFVHAQCMPNLRELRLANMFLIDDDRPLALPPRLERLMLELNAGSGSRRLRASQVPLWPATLTDLELRGGVQCLPPRALPPTLRELTLQLGSYRPDASATVGKWQQVLECALPELAHLDVAWKQPEEGAACTDDDVAARLLALLPPTLRTLRMKLHWGQQRAGSDASASVSASASSSSAAAPFSIPPLPPALRLLQANVSKPLAQHLFDMAPPRCNVVCWPQ